MSSLIDARLVVALPSKARPESVPRMAEAFRYTHAFDQGAHVVWAIDPRDRMRDLYLTAILEHFGEHATILDAESDGMVGPTNHIGRWLIEQYGEGSARPFAVMSMGDDHVPRSDGWADSILLSLAFMGTGWVYPNDGHRGEKLATAWAQTFDTVRALNRIVPCLTTHLFSDNSIMELARAADCLRYLPQVLIEHMHPLAGKAGRDDSYRRTSSKEMWFHDQARFNRWRSSDRFKRQVEIIRGLIKSPSELEPWPQEESASDPIGTVDSGEQPDSIEGLSDESLTMLGRLPGWDDSEAPVIMVTTPPETPAGISTSRAGKGVTPPKRGQRRA